MLQSMTDDRLAEQLLRIAREPELRGAVYERLGEYCHQCRNRLNSLKLSLYLVIRQSPESSVSRWERIERHYQELERRVDQIQTLCRPLALSKVTLGLDLLLDDRRAKWVDLMGRSGKTLEFDRPPRRAVTNFDVDRLGQCLDEFVAWRAGDSESGGSATIRWWSESGSIYLVWEEEGLPSSSVGATWILPLMVRVVQAHDGEIRVENHARYRVELSWPTGIPLP